MRLVLLKGNSMVLRLEDLKNHRSETQDAAAVTAKILRGASELWTGTLTPVAGSPGDYEVGIPPAESGDMAVGELLSYEVTAAAGGLTYHDTGAVRVMAR